MTAAPAVTLVSDPGHLQLIHHAWLCGYDQGYAHGQSTASEELARAWLLQLADQEAREATQLAYRRHGSGWAQAISAQAQPQEMTQ